MTSALDPARWSRRTFLLVSAGVVGAGATGLAGCTAPEGSTSPQAPDGAAGGRPTTAATGTQSPAPTGPPVAAFPGSVAGAALEDALAARAAIVLAVGKKRLGKQGRALVRAIRDQHRAHAGALRTTDPTDPGSSTATDARPTSGSTPTGSPTTPTPSFAKAVDQLVSAETKAAAKHRATALSTTGLAALLWGSMASSAAAIAAILTTADLAGDDPQPAATAVAAVKARAPMPVVTVVVAEQEMVRQLHAIIYGYQLALGRLTGSRRDTAAAELKRHRILRDRLTARLLARKADVPVAAPAYVPSTNPRNAATAAKLIRQMESALVPFCGLWLAATTTPGERTEALNQVGRTTGVARQWGASQPAWPGWKPA